MGQELISVVKINKLEPSDQRASSQQFFERIFFKSIRINVQMELMKSRLIYCEKSRIFDKKRACTFAQIRSKPKSACNIHNFMLACKKSASKDTAKLCLNTA